MSAFILQLCFATLNNASVCLDFDFEMIEDNVSVCLYFDFEMIEDNMSVCLYFDLASHILHCSTLEFEMIEDEAINHLQHTQIKVVLKIKSSHVLNRYCFLLKEHRPEIER